MKFIVKWRWIIASFLRQLSADYARINRKKHYQLLVFRKTNGIIYEKNFFQHSSMDAQEESRKQKEEDPFIAEAKNYLVKNL